MGHHADDPGQCGPSQVLNIYTPCRSSLRYVWNYTFFSEPTTAYLEQGVENCVSKTVAGEDSQPSGSL